MSGTLAGRHALVTGGASGIGRAIALALAEQGCDVAVGSLPAGGSLPEAAYAARPEADEFARLQENIEKLGVRSIARPLDVRLDHSVDAMIAEVVATFGGIDILVNAAGVSAQQSMLEHTDETWNAVLDINLTGAYRTIKRCFGGMRERRWGRIVNIASTAADAGFPLYSAYCASKSALLGLTRCVALEGAAHGISCNAINPGSVGTEMMRLGSLRRIGQDGQGATAEENFAIVADAMPQHRLIPAEEVAALAVYLCTDDSFGITGEALTISGGAQW